MDIYPEYDVDDLKPAKPQGQRRVYTPSEINRGIRVLLEAQYRNIWLEGEICNFKRHSSGHLYLSLKDDKAQIAAVFFSGQNRYMKFEPKDGLQVVVFGKISLYEPRGQYQLYIERMEPKGMGALQLAFLQMKEKLEKEGLFDRSRKRPIPQFPQTVGVVTSATGAAFHDILNVVNRRFSGTTILLYPVQVQGEGAAPQIARAIREFNAYGGVDVMIVGRGGGSMEDLWAFNEEIVARAVYDSKIPVISAVGHEIDWTICDLVADLRAPTPSAAAELVVQNRADLQRRLDDVQCRIKTAVSGIMDEKKNTLEILRQSYAFRQPEILIEQFSQRVDELLRQLQNYLKNAVALKGRGFQTLAGRLHALSPLAILERGYSITFKEGGAPLKDAAKVQKGDRIITRLGKGTVHSQVTEIDAGKES